jgi:ferredoxin
MEACEPVCPVKAILIEDETPEQWKHFRSWGIMMRRVNLIPSYRLDAFIDRADAGRVHLSARGPPGTVAGLLLGGREGEQ